MRRLLSLFFLSVLLPTLLAGALVWALFLRQEQMAVGRQARDLSRFAAALVGRDLVADRRAVQMVARSPTLDDTIDATRFRMLGDRLLADQPHWRALSVSDRDGVRLLDIPRPIGGRAGGRVVEAASHRKTVQSAQPQVGAIAIGPQGQAAFAVRAPAIRDGRVRYVVSIVLDPMALTRLLELAGPPEPWSIMVLDDSGRVVAKSDDPGAAGRRADTILTRAALEATRTGSLQSTRDGRKVATARVEGAPWTIVTTFPERLYTGPLARGVLVLGLGVLAALLVAVLLARLARRELAAQRVELTRELGAQRLEALGRMTGGVAHDFNNLLTPILAGLDLLAGRLKDDPRNARLAQAALESAERARTLVHRLLSFTRREGTPDEDVDLAVLLGNLRPLLEQSVGPGVQILVEIHDRALHIRVDPAQLELAILNLAVNARDAMPGGGRLTLVGEMARARAGGGLKAGRYVRLSLTDTGTGMDEETLRRAAEPFFTTKPVGQGTGLGLSMAHALAAQAGGALTLTSRPGEGTTVAFWFPPGDAPAATVAAAARAVAGQGARVLLVDDDAEVLAATAAALEDKGFVVVTAACGRAALDRLTIEVPAVLVTDLTMPDMDGAQLARAVRARHGDLPILLLTGFARPDLDLPARVEILEKPFRVEALAGRILSLIGAAGGPAAGTPD